MLEGLALALNIAAGAVQWVNGVRAEELEREKAALEDEYQELLSIDNHAKARVVAGYVARLIKYAEREVAVRDEIATNLTVSRDRAGKILHGSFGDTSPASFRLSVFELERALGKATSERAYLKYLLADLYGLTELIAAGKAQELPGTECLRLPVDYPCVGYSMKFTGAPPKLLHGYRLDFLDAPLGLSMRRAMFVAVDHEERVATLSYTCAVLLEANIKAGGGALSARVIERRRGELWLQFFDTKLVLSGKVHKNVEPNQDVEVFADAWTITDIIGHARRPLLVRDEPRLEGAEEKWSPILLQISDAQLPELADAYQRVENGGDSNKRIGVDLTDGAVVLSIGAVTLVTRVDGDHQVLVLEGIEYDRGWSASAVRLRVTISAFVPGKEEPEHLDRSKFFDFLGAVQTAFDLRRKVLAHRTAATQFRKLSVVYQDQQQHFAELGSLGFVPTKSSSDGNEVEGVILGAARCAWIPDGTPGKGVTPLRLTSPDSSRIIDTISWISRRTGACKIMLRPEGRASSPAWPVPKFDRIERMGEGDQQRVLMRALESAISGTFRSPVVHQAFLGTAGESCPVTHTGHGEVSQLLQSEAAVVAVWGPPGTGKTTLMVQWLLSMFEMGKEATWPRVLISAPTHVAVNNLLERLFKEAPWLEDEIVRYCGLEKIVGTELEPRWHKHLLRRLEDTRPDLDDGSLAGLWKDLLASQGGRKSATAWALGSRHIHAATCVGMARRDYALLDSTFDIAIIDEAGKAFGAEILLPASVSDRVVMLGDHKQLPPTVTSEVLSEEIDYRLPLDEVKSLLQQNMFADLYERLPSTHKGMLTLQHRMHHDIGQLVSELFYDGKLHSARQGGNWSLTRRRVVFVDFSAAPDYREERRGTSRENSCEREALNLIVRRLGSKVGELAPTILVVCPYEVQRGNVEAQVEAMQPRLSIRVATVDAVQGGEADIVILLMTRTRGSKEFLLDPNRLNVALSRAREAIIIVGHADHLAEDPMRPFAQLLEIGQRNACLVVVRPRSLREFESDLVGSVVP